MLSYDPGTGQGLRAGSFIKGHRAAGKLHRKHEIEKEKASAFVVDYHKCGSLFIIVIAEITFCLFDFF